MSILIKGMEMQKNCHECACHKHKYDSGWYDYDVCTATETVFNDGYSTETVHIDTLKERLDNCPLIELPLHGRLIDADALAAEFYKQMSKQDELMELCKRAGDTSNYFTVSKIKTGMLSFLSVLNDAPTIIPASEEVLK